MTTLRARLAALWRGLRRVSGDDAYERYLAYHRARHTGPPLDRAAFTRAEIERKWNGARRCC